MRRQLRESRNQLREELREKPAQLLELREIGVFLPMRAREGTVVAFSANPKPSRNSRNSRNHAPSRAGVAQPVAQPAQPHHTITRGMK
jgi:hypothetical protein